MQPVLETVVLLRVAVLRFARPGQSSTSVLRVAIDTLVCVFLDYPSSRAYICLSEALQQK